MKKITITLNAEGKVEYETEGFVGHACQSEIQKIMLAGNTDEETKKPEYYDSVPDFVNNLG